MRKKIMVYCLIALSVIILGTVIMILLNPLRRPADKIRESILEITPLGTSMEEVIKVIENQKKWEVEWVDYEAGYLRPGQPDPADEEYGKTIIGEKSIWVSIGEYRNIFVTSVTVFWGFDEDSKLIDIFVWKDQDSL